MHRGSSTQRTNKYNDLSDSQLESQSSTSFLRTLDLSRGKPIYRILFILYILLLTFAIVSLTDYSGPGTLDVERYLRKVPFTHVKSFKFDSSTQKWEQQDEKPSLIETHISEDKITVATYNVWFGQRKDSAEDVSPRIKAIIQLLKEKQPHIIALQEVTKPILSVLSENQWIREYYAISDDLNGSTFKGYGVIILSRIPIAALSIQDLPSRMNRKAILLEANINNSPFCFSTAHLESYAQDGETRTQQMQVIDLFLREVSCPNAIFMGDFNFVSEEERKLKISTNLSNFTDVWEKVYSSENGELSDLGYTYDPTRNKLAEKNSRNKSTSSRIDLILLRSKKMEWVPSSASLIGTDPITPGTDLFPSDHFGVVAEIESVKRS